MEHCKDPVVFSFPNFLSSEICEHFIDISKGKLKRSVVSFDDKGDVSSIRTSSGTWIPHNYDSITERVGNLISTYIGIPLENAEKFQIIHYDKSGKYKQHYDSWKDDYSKKTLRCKEYGGARLFTALCYLNDVKKGGGTRFNKLGIDIEPEKGKLLIFSNTISIENKDRHPLSLHEGLPVEEGEKYAFNLWFRECPVNMLYKDFNPEYYNQ